MPLFNSSPLSVGSVNFIHPCFLLELKKTIFYATTADLDSPTFCDQFYDKIKTIMIKEKQLSLNSGNFGNFCLKWENFSTIYDFREPDIEIVLKNGR